MRFLRYLPLAAIALLSACDEAGDVTHTQTPPLAYIRYVHNVADAGRLDMHFIDGTVDYSPNYANMTFRSIGIYQGARAGSRRIRVFPNDTLIANTQAFLIDTTLNLVAGQYYTLMHTGYSIDANGTPDRFIVIDDTRPAQNTGLHISLVQGASLLANMDLFLTATDTTTLAGAPAASNLAVGARSNYIARATGPFAVRVAPTTTFTASASLASTAGVAGTVAVDPIGGHGVAGTQFTAFLFPRSTAGSAATNFTTPGLVMVVDRQPPRTVPD
jgi:hypothetical protein